MGIERQNILVGRAISPVPAIGSQSLLPSWFPVHIFKMALRSMFKFSLPRPPKKRPEDHGILLVSSLFPLPGFLKTSGSG